MHVAERHRELERQRKQRQIRTQSRTRPEPAHGRQLRASHAAAEPFCRHTRELCYNVTMPTIGPRCDSSGVLQKINIASTQSYCRARDGTSLGVANTSRNRSIALKWL